MLENKKAAVLVAGSWKSVGRESQDRRPDPRSVMHNTTIAGVDGWDIYCRAGIKQFFVKAIGI
jgi:hypothetical protein